MRDNKPKEVPEKDMLEQPLPPDPQRTEKDFGALPTANARYWDPTPAWGLLTVGDINLIEYLAGHLISARESEESATPDPHAGDSRDLALDGFAELKQRWTDAAVDKYEKAVEDNESFDDVALEVLKEIAQDEGLLPEPRFQAAQRLLSHAEFLKQQETRP